MVICVKLIMLFNAGGCQCLLSWLIYPYKFWLVWQLKSVNYKKKTAEASVVNKVCLCTCLFCTESHCNVMHSGYLHHTSSQFPLVSKTPVDTGVSLHRAQSWRCRDTRHRIQFSRSICEALLEVWESGHRYSMATQTDSASLFRHVRTK